MSLPIQLRTRSSSCPRSTSEFRSHPSVLAQYHPMRRLSSPPFVFSPRSSDELCYLFVFVQDLARRCLFSPPLHPSPAQPLYLRHSRVFKIFKIYSLHRSYFVFTLKSVGYIDVILHMVFYQHLAAPWVPCSFFFFSWTSAVSLSCRSQVSRLSSTHLSPSLRPSSPYSCCLVLSATLYYASIFPVYVKNDSIFFLQKAGSGPPRRDSHQQVPPEARNGLQRQ